MAFKQTIEIEFNPEYLEETAAQYGDLEAAIREVIPWVIFRVAVTRDFDELSEAFGELEGGEDVFRAFVSCEVLGQAASRPDVRAWLCQYLSRLRLSEGACYQLACAYSRLGVEARRAGRFPAAVRFAKRGLSAVADVPSSAVTSNLYYNLGIAMEGMADVQAAIEAFEDSAEIDEHIGRADEAALSQQRIKILQQHL